jgi:hypothetical protein
VVNEPVPEPVPELQGQLVSYNFETSIAGMQLLTGAEHCGVTKHGIIKCGCR